MLLATGISLALTVFAGRQTELDTDAARAALRPSLVQVSRRCRSYLQVGDWVRMERATRPLHDLVAALEHKWDLALGPELYAAITAEEDARASAALDALVFWDCLDLLQPLYEPKKIHPVQLRSRLLCLREDLRFLAATITAKPAIKLGERTLGTGKELHADLQRLVAEALAAVPMDRVSGSREDGRRSLAAIASELSGLLSVCLPDARALRREEMR